MSNSYVYTSQVAARLGLADLTDTDEELLQTAIDWASDYLDSYTSRQFTNHAEVRYFRRDDLYDRVLYVGDDLLSVSVLTNGDGNTIASSEYWLEPRNAPAEVPPQPYNAIRLKTTSSWTFPSDSWISVSGQWGFSSQPDALIIGACLRLAEWYYRSRAPLTTTTLFDGSIQHEKPEGFPTEVLAELDQRMRLAP